MPTWLTAAKPWLLLLGALTLVLAGMCIEAWRENAGTVKAIVKQEKATIHDDAITQTHTVSAATHIGAIAIHSQALHDQIPSIQFTTPIPGGGIHHEPSAASVPALLPSPLASPDFQRLYDCGSTPDVCRQADDMPAATATKPPTALR